MINRERGEGGRREEKRYACKYNAPYFRYGYRKIRGGVLYNEPAIIHDEEILEAPRLTGIFSAGDTSRHLGKCLPRGGLRRDD